MFISAIVFRFLIVFSRVPSTDDNWLKNKYLHSEGNVRNARVVGWNGDLISTFGSPISNMTRSVFSHSYSYESRRNLFLSP